MRVFVVYKGERLIVDVTEEDTIAKVKSKVREAFCLGADGLDGLEKKVLILIHQGADLQDNWPVEDIGIYSGVTIKAIMRDQIKPILYIKSMFNREIHPIVEMFSFRTFSVASLRALATRKTGVPVGAFRLVSPSGIEMYDCHKLEDYEIGVGDTISLETWDGWNDFFTAAVKGITTHVFSYFSTTDEVMARYQMRLALYMAAHFGHVDLAVSLLKQGVRADEPVGDHPARVWCRSEQLSHIDSMKSPVHEAAEMGQLGVLRSFVHNNVCTVLAKDGNHLTPLNIALRKKQKPCASFLLTKQWSKINYTSKTAIPLNIFVKMKRWGDRSKEKVLVLYGQWKSSVKNTKRHVPTGALVGNGVLLDGFSESRMTSKPASLMRQAELEEIRRKKRMQTYHDAWKERMDIDPETYFKSLIAMGQSCKLPKVNKWSRMVGNPGKEDSEGKSEGKSNESSTDKESVVSTPEPNKKFKLKSESHSNSEAIKLPPIHERLAKGLSASHQNLTSGSDFDVDAAKPRAASRSTFIHTGYTNMTKSVDSLDDSSQASKRKTLTLKRSCDYGSQTPIEVLHLDNSQPVFGPAKNAMISRITLEQYEKHRGLPSREYATRCLEVANSFKEKPWLHRVRQAMTIAAQGVKKTVTKRPHMFRDQALGGLPMENQIPEGMEVTT